ncbi:lysophospholipid acyltransferase family protein [Riemerella anatipestifer]|uniref:Lipid a biosynthesis acyltransferase n=1 Tax=Riemerella anatipestifer TaxID=34085 RepID=A0A1S7DUJ0_RIEAN|nr:lysophospholipid acyltransferase family protein [Riemerella anatipestifer]AQY22785.1 lipid a biosynthesis acyltransferase [Riemerella anatipestifer]MBO4232825.1 lipid A biosynthesis acyltransferase [Riemerella anatipestifer]MCO4304445.1 lysophospholipid acyltransferase family protein [Riemerella anatipestifer]MCO7352023.1 lysophospholipid acyltransferase family protein [Riemerella anatipestifer]MCQ4038931.1 lysophospholipid acyltransferase family protein [Riemerella anatipestifer]
MLNNILFRTVYIISKLPLRVLYIFSDLIFVLSYYVVGYRKKVVLENLRKSFPEKSETEINTICKKFYQNFADYIVETLKTFTVSNNELRVRVQHINQHLFSEALEEQKNIIMLSGHIFNWEWFNALAEVVPQKYCFPVYRKMQSAFWEEKVKLIRCRFGNTALEAKQVIRHILKQPNDGNSVYMFVADQSPYVVDVDYGLEFLNQKTPAFIGYDKLSTKMDLIFIYCEMKKIKRGFYQVNYYRIYPDGERFKPYEVVNKFHKMLETTIKKRPDNWLWSHRRWKYQDAIKTFAK